MSQPRRSARARQFKSCPIYLENVQSVFPVLVEHSDYAGAIIESIRRTKLIDGRTLAPIVAAKVVDKAVDQDPSPLETSSSSSQNTSNSDCAAVCHSTSTRRTPLAIHVVNMDSLACALHITTEHKDTNPCVLNMASDKHPGGGYEGGSRAQEESLCRRTLLYPTLNFDHRCVYVPTQKRSWYPLRERDLIYSPRVLTVRDENNKLLALDEFTTASYISAAALRHPKTNSTGEYMTVPKDKELMYAKWRDVLRLAAHEGHRNVVLSAWGSGAFGMPAQHVSEMLHEILTQQTEFTYAFDHVYIAILDPYMNTQNYRVYSTQFGNQSQTKSSTTTAI